MDGVPTLGGATSQEEIPKMSDNAKVESELPVILIGASGSIGVSILERLLSEGFSVHGTVRTESAISLLRQRFHNDSASFSLLDVTNFSQTRDVINRVALRAGGILGLVYSAGLQVRAPLHEVTEEQMSNLIAVNLTGAFVASQASLTHMVPKRNGRFVFIGSLTAKFAIKGIAPYAMAKSGLSSLARSIAVEYGSAGITANSVLPGRIESKMIADVLSDARAEITLSRIPAGRLGQPEDVSHAVAFLMSEHSSYINGSELVIDGAWLGGGGNISG